MSNNPSGQQSSTAAPSPGLSATSSSPSRIESRSKSKSPGVKPINVFSDDGSFLDRIRPSKKEDDKKKEQDALERKKNFGNRFRNRGKRPHPPQNPSSNSDTTPETEEAPKKKQKVSDKPEKEDNSSQAEYHKAINSYPTSLKDGGTGVRPLVK